MLHLPRECLEDNNYIRCGNESSATVFDGVKVDAAFGAARITSPIAREVLAARTTRMNDNKERRVDGIEWKEPLRGPPAILPQV